MDKNRSRILYGISERDKIINEIVDDLGAYDICFDLQLILTEAITNAYKHGNKENPDLPIYLRYYCKDGIVIFEIKDSGTGLEDVKVKEDISSENLLDESGRGLYLIKCYCDDVKVFNNTLILQKRLLKSVG